MRKIAAITMARNDEFFLNRWIKYYGIELGEENLFIILDGVDQKIPTDVGKVNITVVEHVQLNRIKGDKSRITRISSFAEVLFQKYDLVIGTDVDEFLVVDPYCKKSLKVYLDQVNCSTSISALGIDVGQKLGIEDKIDENKPFLAQRKYALISTRYTKPIIISKPVSWGSGFHRVKGHNFKIDKNLYLFHFGSVDLELMQQKINDIKLINAGWKGHLSKRANTISLVSHKSAYNADKLFSFIRLIQSICRPIYAWNKPTMLGWKPIIRIPERFENVL